MFEAFRPLTASMKLKPAVVTRIVQLVVICRADESRIVSVGLAFAWGLVHVISPLFALTVMPDGALESENV